MKRKDTFRTLEAINEADPRGRDRPTLEKRHEALASITLNRAIPLPVARIIETAKNLSLYAHFVFRFHPVAQLLGYIALEVALKEKWQASNGKPVDKDHQTLKPLLDHALEKHWITTETFKWARETAAHSAKIKKLNTLYEQLPAGGFPPPVASEEDIQKELDSYAHWATGWAEAASDARNRSAHGDLHSLDQSEGPLRLIVEAINGMFVGNTEVTDEESS
ncbi:MAG: hypothetical protein ACREMY_02145 [bacterium]